MGLVSVRPALATRVEWRVCISGPYSPSPSRVPHQVPLLTPELPSQLAHLHPVDQWPPNFLTPGTSFMGGSFPTDQGMLPWGAAVSMGGASLMCPPLCGSIPHRPGPVLPCVLGSEDACGSLSIPRASTCSAPPLPALLPYRDSSVALVHQSKRGHRE